MTWTESLAHRISASNRRRKWDIFLKLIKPTAQTSILDVGYASIEYAGTDNFLEKHYPYRSQITALGIDDPRDFGRDTLKSGQYDTKEGNSRSTMHRSMCVGPTRFSNTSGRGKRRSVFSRRSTGSPGWLLSQRRTDSFPWKCTLAFFYSTSCRSGF